MQIGPEDEPTQDHLVQQVVESTGCEPRRAKYQLAAQQRRRQAGGWRDGRSENALRASEAARQSGKSGRPPSSFTVRDGQRLSASVRDARGLLATGFATVVEVTRGSVELLLDSGERIVLTR